ncbi:MAG: hypothetical protein H0U49_00740 [Parachlamydiaceae bacterium]|nr:hypothetical protein [Parachlamydiaceae bacterium]
METKGIRILDKENRIVKINLSNILEEIKIGDQFEWSILYLHTTGDLGKGKSIPEFEEQIIKSEKGFFITWKEINDLSLKFWDLMDIIIIASRNKNLLLRYKDDQEMYQLCDIVIEKFDSCFWEVFSKDEKLINKLESKFKEVEFLDSDFKKYNAIDE